MNTLRALPRHWPLLFALVAPLNLRVDSLAAEDSLAFPAELAPSRRTRRWCTGMRFRGCPT